jgi:putative restriction endonuclease
MAFGVFIHRSDSIYDDSPAERYQFPAQYLSRAQPSIGDWILYYEPRKVAATRGYFAVAKVERIIPDPSTPAMYRALIEPGSYLDFATPVPFAGVDGPVERGVLNDQGRISSVPSRRCARSPLPTSIGSSRSASTTRPRCCRAPAMPWPTQ